MNNVDERARSNYLIRPLEKDFMAEHKIECPFTRSKIAQLAEKVMYIEQRKKPVSTSNACIFAVRTNFAYLSSLISKEHTGTLVYNIHGICVKFTQNTWRVHGFLQSQTKVV